MNLGYYPFDGRETEFKETATAVCQTKSAGRVLVWEGRYESQPRLGMAPSVYFLVLAVPILPRKDGNGFPIRYRAYGVLAMDLGPLAIVELQCDPEFREASDGLPCSDCGLHVRRVFVKRNWSVQGHEMRVVWSKPEEGDGGKWTSALARVRIRTSIPPSSDDRAAASILDKYQVLLTPEGKILPIADRLSDASGKERTTAPGSSGIHR